MSLRQASLAWFSKVTVKVELDTTDVASLAAWLERHQGESLLALVRAKVFKLVEAVCSARGTLRDVVCLTLFWFLLLPAAQLNLVFSSDSYNPFSESMWACDTIEALPAHLVSSFTASQELPAAASTLTALTSLSLTGVCGGYGFLLVDALRPLSRLQQLSLSSLNVSSSAQQALALPALKELQALILNGCSLEELPPALSTHTQLTSLDLSANEVSSLHPLATLQRLQSLNLRRCSLAAVPQQLSALTALTRLDLSENYGVQGGWQHLLPLCQLQDLKLRDCDLTAVPEQLAALKALTCLNLACSDCLDGSLQHLLPLTQLRHLNLGSCRLTTVPAQLSALTALTRLKLGTA
jgi:Leucine-rich repeat (LRR) protein